MEDLNEKYGVDLKTQYLSINVDSFFIESLYKIFENSEGCIKTIKEKINTYFQYTHFNIIEKDSEETKNNFIQTDELSFKVPIISKYSYGTQTEGNKKNCSLLLEFELDYENPGYYPYKSNTWTLFENKNIRVIYYRKNWIYEDLIKFLFTYVENRFSICYLKPARR
mgnify:CR=1 FL=1